MAEQTPFDFFHVVSAGRLSAGMPAWDDALSLQQRWDAVSYLWTLRGVEAGGRRLYERDCAGCHGAMGDAGGTDLGDPATLARHTDGDLERLIRHGVPGSGMPGTGEGLSAEELRGLVAHVRALATADGVHGDADTAIERARTLLSRTVVLVEEDRSAAADAGLDAYLAYETVEKRVAVVAPELSRRLENEFAAVQAAVRRGAAAEEVRTAAAAVGRDLDVAEATLDSRYGAAAAFLQALMIILREGFEALLIVAALGTYVVRTGHREVRWRVYTGAGAGLAASLLTAWVVTRVWPVGTGSQEALEGVTMLVAAAVLFSVSYWLISRAEAVRWQRYIQGRVNAALARGSMLALAGTAFLAVYREGVETVLFYQALLGAAAGQEGYVVGGLVAGGCALALLYLLTTALGLRLPLGAFFLGTGFMLYAMAFVFAGSGVRELQDAALLSVTPWPDWPTVGWLGMSPSLEVAAVQTALLLAAVAAGLITLRRRAALARADHIAGSEATSRSSVELG
jgi:high-affinity iron transporter